MLREFKLKKIGSYMDFVDNSIKSVFENNNGNVIEITLLQNKMERDVVCVPTHYFCTMGCKMCHLTNFFSDKKMLPINVEEFNEALVRSLCIEENGKLIRRTYRKDILVSFMGVGEPLLNIKLIKDVFESNVLVNKLNYENVSYALATMFPTESSFEELIKVIDENNIPLKVHFSLHNPFDVERKKLIPNSVNSIYKICSCLDRYRIMVNNNEKILENYRKFHKNTEGIEIHYTLIDKNNDSLKELDALKTILDGFKFVIKFIDFNEVGELKKSKMSNIWKKVFEYYNEKYPGYVKYYCPPGKNIGSSCGQFTKHFFVNTETEEEKMDFEKWKEKHEIKEFIV